MWSKVHFASVQTCRHSASSCHVGHKPTSLVAFVVRYVHCMSRQNAEWQAAQASYAKAIISVSQLTDHSLSMGLAGLGTQGAPPCLRERQQVMDPTPRIPAPHVPPQRWSHLLEALSGDIKTKPSLRVLSRLPWWCRVGRAGARYSTLLGMGAKSGKQSKQKQPQRTLGNN